MGSMLGACLVSLPLNLTVIARDTDVSVGRLVNGMLSSWAWRFVLLAGPCWWVGTLWFPKNILEAALAVVFITAAYVAVMLTNVLRSPLGIYIRPIFASFRARFAPSLVRFSS